MKLYLGSNQIHKKYKGNNYFKSQVYYLEDEAVAFLNATGITDNTIEEAINNLVVDLKTEGLWDKMVGIYPFVGGTATTHKYNLKDPRDLDAAYRLSFNGGITHSSSGVKGNGSTGYYDTHYGLKDFNQDSAHISVYLTDNISEDKVDIGAADNSISFCSFQIAAREVANTQLVRVISGNTAYRISGRTDSRGLFASSRTNAFTMLGSRNTSQTSFTEGSVTAGTSRNVYGLAMNTYGTADFFATKNQAFASFGSGLSDVELDDYYTIVQSFQTTLGRQV